ncbi:MAG TPA: VWA domain-containing protein [Kofleriaceae bacterium]|nr:VWA domain-containing protein [Kofleriaceae bacterium]
MRMEVLAEVTDGGATVHLLARLEAEAAASGERPPVNLALAIDRSSSMRGPRLAQAVRAASQVVDRLDPRDRLTVIAFDAGVRVVFGPERVTPEAADKLLRALGELQTGVGTNLAAAIKSGAERIRAGYVRGALARLVLLTDGQPSVGVTDGEKLCALVEAEWETGVTVTAMGIGESFEDELLAEMARRGRGGFHYLATPADIPAAFGRELAGLFAIAATQAELKLVPHEHVTAIDLLHRLPSRASDDGLVVEVGEVAAGAPRQVLFRLVRDPTSSSRHLVTARLTYRTPDGRPGDASIVGVELPRLPLGEAARAVTVERFRLAVAAAVDQAWARRAAGDRDRALAGLREVAAQITAARGQNAAPAAELDPLIADLDAASDAVQRSAAEREKIRRRLRERSQVTLLGHSTLARLPVGPGTDDD